LYFTLNVFYLDGTSWSCLVGYPRGAAAAENHRKT
jgi:hypothetical protein